MNGFNDEQIVEIRTGSASFDAKLDALATFVRETTINRGKPNSTTTDALLAAGYNRANLIDILLVIGDKIVSNFLHGVTQIPVDFPAANELETATV